MANQMFGLNGMTAPPVPRIAPIPSIAPAPQLPPPAGGTPGPGAPTGPTNSFLGGPMPPSPSGGQGGGQGGLGDIFAKLFGGGQGGQGGDPISKLLAMLGLGQKQQAPFTPSGGTPTNSFLGHPPGAAG